MSESRSDRTLYIIDDRYMLADLLPTGAYLVDRQTSQTIWIPATVIKRLAELQQEAIDRASV